MLYEAYLYEFIEFLQPDVPSRRYPSELGAKNPSTPKPAPCCTELGLETPSRPNKVLLTVPRGVPRECNAVLAILNALFPRVKFPGFVVASPCTSTRALDVWGAAVEGLDSRTKGEIFARTIF